MNIVIVKLINIVKLMKNFIMNLVIVETIITLFFIKFIFFTNNIYFRISLPCQEETISETVCW